VREQAELPATERVRLARLAGEAVAATDGVAATAGRTGVWVTPDGDRSIAGVVAIALPQGRVEIALHVDAIWPAEPLEALADALRGRLARSAQGAGLGDRLGPVAVAFHDVRAPGGDA
jgi:hypothetical protein